MSVVPLNVPAVVEKVTVEPPVVKLTPWISRDCTFTIEVLEPSATIEPGAALSINECAALAVPGTLLDGTACAHVVARRISSHFSPKAESPSL